MLVADRCSLPAASAADTFAQPAKRARACDRPQPAGHRSLQTHTEVDAMVNQAITCPPASPPWRCVGQSRGTNETIGIKVYTAPGKTPARASRRGRRDQGLLKRACRQSHHRGTGMRLTAATGYFELERFGIGSRVGGGGL
jgi:hypothetical protein